MSTKTKIILGCCIGGGGALIIIIIVAIICCRRKNSAPSGKDLKSNLRDDAKNINASEMGD